MSVYSEHLFPAGNPLSPDWVEFFCEQLRLMMAIVLFYVFPACINVLRQELKRSVISFCSHWALTRIHIAIDPGACLIYFDEDPLEDPPEVLFFHHNYRVFLIPADAFAYFSR